MNKIIINFIYNLKLKNYEVAKNYYKQLNENGLNDDEIISLLKSKEVKATSLVISYYLHKFDLETLHDRLYKLFGSYKEAVIWLSDNDLIIKNIILK